MPIVSQSKEVRRICRTSVHMPSETYALLPAVGGIIDHLGVAAAKVTLAYRLEVSLPERRWVENVTRTCVLSF